MTKRPRNDHAIFFRLPTALVEQIDAAAYDCQMSRTQFIRQAILRALKGCQQ
jgi:metal-responsive CopG/Arc/MetJ family transcriptional regulator